MIIWCIVIVAMAVEDADVFQGLTHRFQLGARKGFFDTT